MKRKTSLRILVCFFPWKNRFVSPTIKVFFRGEFVPTVQSSRPNAALMVLLPVVASRVRLVAFDVVIDSHEDSDIEISPS